MGPAHRGQGVVAAQRGRNGPVDVLLVRSFVREDASQ